MGTHLTGQVLSDKWDSTSGEGDIFIFNFLLLYYFQQSKAMIFIAVQVRDNNLQKVVLVLLFELVLF